MTIKTDEYRPLMLQVPSPSPSAKSVSSEAATPKVGSRKWNRESNDFSAPSELVVEYPLATSLKQPILPHPIPVDRCPLFCCFYAEFDIKVGPRICFQSPPDFMEQQIDISVERIEEILVDAFEEIRQHPEELRHNSADAHSDNENSIFDSCSEYIITGSELTGKLINLSTNNIHVLSRPTMISNERYERNSLLFCVGFIHRRTEDSRPFRPVLNKWALTLRDLELECHFLSTPSTRGLIQQHLERLLVSLNSTTLECNLLLNEANILNLKLFHPPKVPAKPVPEYAVPIFLRRDRQMHMYDWDLAINWVSLHIDGVTNARQISIKAEVDMEMVLSCLRVLRHHGVIALVDMFFFTNHYECTDETASLLLQDSKLMDEAVTFVAHRHSQHEQISPLTVSITSPGHGLKRGMQLSTSPSSFDQSRLHGQTTSSYVPENGAPSVNSHVSQLDCHQLECKAALKELYLLCSREISIGDIWVRLLTGHQPQTRTVVNWKKMFQLIDHRRFTTFGIVHGLLRRVHNFPLLLNTIRMDSEMDCMDCFDKDGLHGSNGRAVGPQHQQVSNADEPFFHRRVACLMDGRHSDDELVCTFGKPLSDLFDLMNGGLVVSAYAPAIQ
ncbi:hypothetical protein MPSEU_000139800 [Mayamaea pseudoterrestris]|nr:hypothetical protein MPSEU_000139800 [Mayamaea pseudoterrestris]